MTAVERQRGTTIRSRHRQIPNNGRSEPYTQQCQRGGKHGLLDGGEPDAEMYNTLSDSDWEVEDFA